MTRKQRQLAKRKRKLARKNRQEWALSLTLWAAGLAIVWMLSLMPTYWSRAPIPMGVIAREVLA